MAAGAHPILTQLLLALQFCLGVWQIIKFTPLGGLLECTVKRWLLLPLGFSTPYSQLHHFSGFIYKTVNCHITLSSPHEVPVSNTSLGDAEADISASLSTQYLQKKFSLDRRGDKLFVNGAMAYYVMDAAWLRVVEMAKAAPSTVFIKGYKEFWQQVATGGVMSFCEVLDSLILDNHSLLKLDNDLFLPVNLSVSEEKLLKFLNLAGLFLQTKPSVPWYYSFLLSFTSAILEFFIPLRVWLYNKANCVFCFMIQGVAENFLSRQWRRQVYALGLWVENLKPSNDIELRIVKGCKVCTVVIAGGAKVPHTQDACVVQVSEDDDDVMEMEGAEPVYKAYWECYLEGGDHSSNHTMKAHEKNGVGKIKLEAHFRSKQKKCWVRASTVAWVEVECSCAQFKRLKTFLACVAKHRSGSLKICDGYGNVHVRNFRESVLCYFKNDCPTVYELHLDNVTVK